MALGSELANILGHGVQAGSAHKVGSIGSWLMNLDKKLRPNGMRPA